MAEVRVPFAQDVEGDERDRHVRPRAPSVREMDAALKGSEASRFALFVEGHDLAVEDNRVGVLGGPALQLVRDLGELLSLLVTQARPQACRPPRRHFCNGADTVVLGFVNELWVDERRLGKRCEHRPQCQLRVRHATLLRDSIVTRLAFRARQDALAHDVAVLLTELVSTEVVLGFHPVGQGIARPSAARQKSIVGADPDNFVGRRAGCHFTAPGGLPVSGFSDWLRAR